MKHRRRACRRQLSRSVARRSALGPSPSRCPLTASVSHPGRPQVSTATRALLILRTSALANRHGGDDDSSCKVAIEKRMGLRVLGQGGAAQTLLVYRTGLQRYPLLPMTVELEPRATDDSSWGWNATQSLWRYVDAPAASTVGANKTGRRGLWSFAKPRNATLFQGTSSAARKDRGSSDQDQKVEFRPAAQRKQPSNPARGRSQPRTISWDMEVVVWLVGNISFFANLHAGISHLLDKSPLVANLRTFCGVVSETGPRLG